MTRYQGSLHKPVLSDGSGEGWSLELPLYHSVARQLHPIDYPVQPTAVVLITLIGHQVILYRHKGAPTSHPNQNDAHRPVSP
jgi:hypothetical protein